MRKSSALGRPGARYRPSDVVDFVVVGSGAAGGVIAKELATAGLSVVVLEQGPRLEAREFEHDEFKYFFRNGIVNDQPQTFAPTPNQTAMPGVGRLLYARLVGGGSVHFTANYWRFHEIDFVEASRQGSISGTGFADWPITYAELEPYYTKAEWELGVSGTPGSVRPAAVAPLPHAAAAGQVVRRAVRAGRAQAGIPSPADAHGDPLAAVPRPRAVPALRLLPRASAASSAPSPARSPPSIPMAEATGRCEIRAGCYVRKVETGRRAAARPASSTSTRTKREHLQRASAVVLCANGAETPRLLLMSQSNRFPQGLANSSGLVGKHLMFNGGGERRRHVRARRSTSTRASPPRA